VTYDPIPTFRSLVRWIRLPRAWSAVARVTVAIVAVCLLGFVSSALSVGAARRSTMALVEESYKRIAVDAPPPVWLDPALVGAFPSPFSNDPFLTRSLRTWIFAPRTVYAPDQGAFCLGCDPCHWALLVIRMPLPFVIRAHYDWAAVAAPQGAGRSVGRGSQEIGVVTHLAFFGLAIPIDQNPRPRASLDH
jgi:hypothetical protein